MKQIFSNGWYALKTENEVALYRADDTLVADKLEGCHVYDNGWYMLESKDDKALYRNDESLVTDKLITFYLYDNGTYKLTTRDHHRPQILKNDGTLISD